MTTPSATAPNASQLQAARALRESALQALREAQAIDGLMPHVVLHGHEYGASAYLYWSESQPSKAEAAAILDCEFEPDRGETLDVNEPIALEELTGVHVVAAMSEGEAHPPRHGAGEAAIDAERHSGPRLRG